MIDKGFPSLESKGACENLKITCKGNKGLSSIKDGKAFHSLRWKKRVARVGPTMYAEISTVIGYNYIDLSILCGDVLFF